MRILLAGLVYFGSLMAAARADQPASFDEAVASLEHRPGFVDLYLDAEPPCCVEWCYDGVELAVRAIHL